jgi:hypothetical protein
MPITCRVYQEGIGADRQQHHHDMQAITLQGPGMLSTAKLL